MPAGAGPSGDWVSRLDQIIEEDPGFADSPFAAEIRRRAMQARAAGWAPGENELDYLAQLVRATRQAGAWRSWPPPSFAAVGNLPETNIRASTIVPMAQGSVITASRPSAPPVSPSTPQTPVPATLPAPTPSPTTTAAPPPPVSPQAQTSQQPEKKPAERRVTAEEIENFYNVDTTIRQGETPEAAAKRLSGAVEKMRGTVGKLFAQAAQAVDAHLEAARIYEDTAEKAGQYSWRAHPLRVHLFRAKMRLAAQRERASAGNLMLQLYDRTEPLLRRATVGEELAAQLAKVQAIEMSIVDAQTVDQLNNVRPDAAAISNHALRAYITDRINHKEATLEAKKKYRQVAGASKRAAQAIKNMNNHFDGEINGAVKAFEEARKSGDVVTMMNAASEARNKITAAFIGYTKALHDLVPNASLRAREVVRQMVDDATGHAMEIVNTHLDNIRAAINAAQAKRKWRELEEQKQQDLGMRNTRHKAEILKRVKILGKKRGVLFSDFGSIVRYVTKHAVDDMEFVAEIIDVALEVNMRIGERLLEWQQQAFKKQLPEWIKRNLRATGTRGRSAPSGQSGEAKESAKSEKPQNKGEVIDGVVGKRGRG